MDWTIRALFDIVAGLSPLQRDLAFTDAAQRGCPESVIAAVRNMLNAAEGSGGVSDTLAGMHHIREQAERAAVLGMLERIGPYRIKHILGRGGFGVVYLAHEETEVRRDVAIKVLDPGRATPAAIRHFELERQVLATLNHPNIATMLSAGTTDAGQMYLVMELVGRREGDATLPGLAITEYCDRHTLTIPERLRLFMDVGHAVQHAHTRGVIHRDLKPSNVLISEVEGKPIPKVIDFGVSKLVQAGGTIEATMAAQPIGTLAYMSPEQAAGGADVSTLSDVYGLGAVLYELICGIPPLNLSGLTLPQAIALVMSGDVVPAGRRLADIHAASVAGKSPTAGIARTRGVAPCGLEMMLKRELEWVPQKAMSKDPSRRYKTSSELSDDLRRYLDEAPLIAGPESAWYRARKIARRHRVAVGAGAAIALTLAAATVTSTWFWKRERAANSEKQLALQEAESTVHFLTDDLLGAPDPDEGRVGVRVVDILDRAASELDRGRRSPQVRVRAATAIGVSYNRIGEFAKARPILERALEDAESTLPGTLWHDNAQLALGETYFRLGRGSQAAKLLEPAIAGMERRGNASVEQLDTFREMLAGAFKHWESKGDLEDKLNKAERLYTSVRQSRESRLAPHDRSVLLARYNLALVTLRRAETNELRKTACWEDALGQMKAVRQDAMNGGETTAALALWTESEIASLLLRLERHNEADEYYERAIRGMERRFDQEAVGPKSSWRTVEAIGNYGTNLLRSGRKAEALKQYEKAWKRMSESQMFPSGHEERIKAMFRVADALVALGRGDDGRAKLDEAWLELVQSKASVDQRHVFAQKVLDRLGPKLDDRDREIWKERRTETAPRSGAS